VLLLEGLQLLQLVQSFDVVLDLLFELLFFLFIDQVVDVGLVIDGRYVLL